MNWNTGLEMQACGVHVLSMSNTVMLTSHAQTLTLPCLWWRLGLRHRCLPLQVKAPAGKVPPKVTSYLARLGGIGTDVLTHLGCVCAEGL